MSLVDKDLSKVSYEELIEEWDKCQELWGKYSCDCFGFYIDALHKEITKRGGWPPKYTKHKLFQRPSIKNYDLFNFDDGRPGQKEYVHDMNEYIEMLENLIVELYKKYVR